MRRRSWLITTLLFASVLWTAESEKRAVVRGSATVADLTCASSATLDALGVCIRNQMPKSGSNGFVAPTAAEQADWRSVVYKMLQGSCDFSLPASLSGVMQIKTFTDSGNGRNYCVLMEAHDADGNGIVDHGWGTFIVNNNATRELSHQAPHPITDSTTEIQAITIFKETDSRSYLMAGAPRDANSANSACQSSFKEADVAHNTANMFHATNQALINWYGAASWTAIQWHGMAADTCPNTDVFPSHGMNVKPVATDKISVLRDNLLIHHPTWDVDLPGADACSLNATDNTQGRLINGVPAGDVCGTPATIYNGKFIHIEQDPNFRNPYDWINPVRDTFPVRKTPPAPTGLTAAAGKGKIALSWNTSGGSKNYKVKRSLINGGPYKVIATGVTGTTYTNTGLRPGVRYYYVVTAVNAAGESGNSNQASARTRFLLE
jgi:Fibronectin type III domain